MDHHDYIYYGAQAKASEVSHFISHVFSTNQQALAEGHRAYPICIWGKHGIGKTELIEAYAKKNGYQFAYFAPAQFEEMGDLIGMPVIKDGQTTFAPPQWVPQTAGPGILLIDDLNRADDRILRGIMQLLQKYELQSWSLPKDWQIICTANPDGGDYSVTPLDDAVITRMQHITMVFDLPEWVNWAEDNHVDSRGINFALSNPEQMHGQRTTPRTLVQFFNAIKPIQNLEKEKGLVQLLAEACLDPATATAFMAFIDQGLNKMVSPKEILLAKQFEGSIYAPLKKMTHQKVLRVDMITTLCHRLVLFLKNNPTGLSAQQVDNLKAFLKIDFLPADIRLSLLRDLSALKHPSIPTILADPSITKLLTV